MGDKGVYYEQYYICNWDINGDILKYTIGNKIGEMIYSNNISCDDSVRMP